MREVFIGWGVAVKRKIQPLTRYNRVRSEPFALRI